MNTARGRVRRPGGRRAQGGFTMVELIIVVVILLILGAVAMPNLYAMIPRFRLNSAAKDLAQVIQHVRLAAIAHGREYRIRFVENDASATSGVPQESKGTYYVEAGNASFNSTDWDILPIGAGEDEGTFMLAKDASTHSYTGISLVGWTPMGGPGIGNTNCVVFSPKGWVSNPSTDFSAGYIYAQFRNKYANPQADIRTVRISRGGSVTVLHGAEGDASGSGSAPDVETVN